MKKLSIVIAIYNQKEYIRSCLENVLAQSPEDTEIICVDDGSADGTREILEEYEKVSPRIRLILHEFNQGTCSTRYDGLAACTGEYMTFMDPDDEYTGDKLGGLLELAEKNRADILEFGTQVIYVKTDEDGSGHAKEGFLCPQEGVLLSENLCKICYTDRRISNFLWNKLYSRSVYKKALEAMENYHLANLSDVVYFLWHFLFFAGSYLGTANVAYRYYAGRGMTMRKNDSLERLRDYCRAGDACRELERLTIRFGRRKEYAGALNNLRSVCIGQSVRHWIEELKKEHRSRGLKVLQEYWGTEAVRSMLAGIYWDDWERVQGAVRGLQWRSPGERSGIVCLLHGDLDPLYARQICRAAREACKENSKLIFIVEEGQADYWRNALKARKEHVFALAEGGKMQYRRRSLQLALLLEEAGAAQVYLAQALKPLYYWDSLTAESAGCRIKRVKLL